MKTCPACRQALPDDALFCPIDGASLAGAESDPLLGSVIADRYVLLERIGQGNSGTIYRGEHVTLRQRIAIKLLFPRLSEDPAAVERFRDEAAGLAQLQNSHIVRVSDFGVSADGRVFFAMEFLEGETLSTVLGREGRFGEARSLSVLRQVGEALAEAHALGFVHRDIRPRNVFLSRKGDKEHVKLLDFGLARLAPPMKGTATTYGTAGLGDPRYLSPEQARGDQVDQRSDVYGLALMAYEMVAGTPPFVGGGTLDVLTKHLEAQPVPLEQRAPGISKAFAGAVARALAKKAKDRYQSVSQFIDALAGKAPVEGAAEAPAGKASSPTVGKVDEASGPSTADEKTDKVEKIAKVGSPATGSAPSVGKASAPSVGKASAPSVGKASAPSVGKASAPDGSGASKPQADKSAAEATAAVASSPGKAEKPKAEPSSPTADPAATLLGTGLHAKDLMAALATTGEDSSQPDSARTLPFRRVPDELEPTEPLAAQRAKTPSGGLDGAVVVLPAGASQAAAPGSDSSRTIVPASAIAPTVAPVAPATQPALAAVKPKPPSAEQQPAPALLARKTPTAPEFKVDGQDASQTGNWFAEGLAAEQELAGKRGSSDRLPAIYDAMEESVSIRRGPSPSMIIGGVVVVTAVVLFLVVFGFKGEDKDRKPGSSTGSAQVEPRRPEPDDPGAAVNRAPTKPEAVNPAPKPETKPEVIPEPKKIAEPEPKKIAEPEPKKVAKPEPKKVIKPEPKKVAKPEPKKVIKPEPKKVAKPEPKKVAKPEPRKVAKPEPKKVAKPEPKKVALAKVEPAGKPGHDPGAADAQVRAGRNALQRGDYSKAKDAFSKALQLSPGSAAAHSGLGDVAFEQGQYGPAVTHFRAAVRTNPRSVRYQVALGNAYFKSGKTRQAVDQYRKALAIDPANAEAKAGLQAAVRRLGGM